MSVMSGGIGIPSSSLGPKRSGEAGRERLACEGRVVSFGGVEVDVTKGIVLTKANSFFAGAGTWFSLLLDCSVLSLTRSRSSSLASLSDSSIIESRRSRLTATGGSSVELIDIQLGDRRRLPACNYVK